MANAPSAARPIKPSARPLPFKRLHRKTAAGSGPFRKEKPKAEQAAPPCGRFFAGAKKGFVSFPVNIACRIKNRHHVERNGVL